LADRLGGLDAALHALQRGLGRARRDTLALVIGFGTARRNREPITGMATVVLVVGGAFSDGRAKGVLRDHLVSTKRPSPARFFPTASRSIRAAT
jgi:uncharacterized protein (DUF1501 family)